MKTITFSALFIITICYSAKSQHSINSVLNAIEKNNTTLAALRDQADADIIRSRTGIQLQNPEFNINYLWGNPIPLGNRTDLSIMQTFLFPTAYGQKNKIADIQNNQVELKFIAEKKEILLKANLLCIDIIYQNKLMIEYKKWLANAQELSISHKAKFDAGEISILEFNKSQLNLLSAQKEYQMLELERQSHLTELTAMNGGVVLALNDTTYPALIPPSDFDQWFSNLVESHPVIQWLKLENEVRKTNEKLSISMSLPRITTGIMSENHPGQKFQGLSVGLTIPLWENKNQTKYARSNTASFISFEEDYMLNLKNKFKSIFDQTLLLQKTLNESRHLLISANSTALLTKSFHNGEISLIEYLMELNLYFSVMREFLDSEREYFRKITELASYI